MNIHVVIGSCEQRITLAQDFFGGVHAPNISVGINPADHLRDDARFMARRVPHHRYDLSVRIDAPAVFCDELQRCGEILRVRDDPASRSGHRSQALYLFEGEFLYRGVKRAILGQFLPCGCHTSCHYHEHTTELFVPVLGDVACWRRSVGWQPLANRLTIERRERHWLHAKNDSFVVIIMVGPYGLTHADHHYDDDAA